MELGNVCDESAARGIGEDKVRESAMVAVSWVSSASASLFNTCTNIASSAMSSSMDASVVPLNTKVPIEAFLPPDPEGRNIQALVTSDDKGLQSGIFALRVSRWSVELMSTLISSARYSSRRGPKNLDKNRSVQEARPATLEKLVEDRTGFGLNVSVIPQRWIGASPTNENITQTLRPWHVRPGDFAVNTNQRGIHEENMLRDWVEIAEAHASKWTVDLQKTVYLTEPRQWWEKELKSRRRYST